MENHHGNGQTEGSIPETAISFHYKHGAVPDATDYLKVKPNRSNIASVTKDIQEQGEVHIDKEGRSFMRASYVRNSTSTTGDTIVLLTCKIKDG